MQLLPLGGSNDVHTVQMCWVKNSGQNKSISVEKAEDHFCLSFFFGFFLTII